MISSNLVRVTGSKQLRVAGQVTVMEGSCVEIGMLVLMLSTFSIKNFKKSSHVLEEASRPTGGETSRISFIVLKRTWGLWRLVKMISEKCFVFSALTFLDYCASCLSKCHKRPEVCPFSTGAPPSCILFWLCVCGRLTRVQ